jgi:hypothetical protein
VALRLLAHVLVDPALGVRTEVEMARIGISPSKPGVGEINLS